MVKRIGKRIGRQIATWYDRHYQLAVTVSALLFLTQLVHLYWLSAHVVAHRLVGASYWLLDPFWSAALSAADYLEIPAIITTSILYVVILRRKFSWKRLLILIGINLQWLHMYWITDEIVLSSLGLGEAGTTMPAWLAWIAIGIDYLELPAIFDTTREAIREFRKRGLRGVRQALKE
ncbi:MAG: hypothetical protein Q8Q11_03425 [bacterium]|nr:hypothetical protein [bacterium]MDZ4248220.1 hypothetical protein [Patescibacteria group bacterium]